MTTPIRLSPSGPYLDEIGESRGRPAVDRLAARRASDAILGRSGRGRGHSPEDSARFTGCRLLRTSSASSRFEPRTRSQVRDSTGSAQPSAARAPSTSSLRVAAARHLYRRVAAPRCRRASAPPQPCPQHPAAPRAWHPDPLPSPAAPPLAPPPSRPSSLLPLNGKNAGRTVYGQSLAHHPITVIDHRGRQRRLAHDVLGAAVLASVAATGSTQDRLRTKRASPMPKTPPRRRSRRMKLEGAPIVAVNASTRVELAWRRHADSPTARPTVTRYPPEDGPWESWSQPYWQLPSKTIGR